MFPVFVSERVPVVTRRAAFSGFISERISFCWVFEVWKRVAMSSMCRTLYVRRASRIRICLGWLKNVRTTVRMRDLVASLAAAVASGEESVDIFGGEWAQS